MYLHIKNISIFNVLINIKIFNLNIIFHMLLYYDILH